MKIAVYSHLQTGGAKKVWNNIIDCLSKEHEVLDYSETKLIRFRIYLVYLVYVYLFLPIEQYLLSLKININKPDIVFVSHHYLTKSPYILRHFKNAIYLCHEEPREFYSEKKCVYI